MTTREYQGCIYYRPALNHSSTLDLDHAQLGLIVNRLPGVPVVLDHKLDCRAGTVSRSWQDAQGSAFIGFHLDTQSDFGRVALDRIVKQGIRGLSLSHFESTMQPREVSICDEGARPYTGIINASKPTRLVDPRHNNARVIITPAPRVPPTTMSSATVSTTTSTHNPDHDPMDQDTTTGNATAAATGTSATDEDSMDHDDADRDNGLAKKTINKKKVSTEEDAREAQDEQDALAESFFKYTGLKPESAVETTPPSPPAQQQQQQQQPQGGGGGATPMDADPEYQEYLRFKAARNKRVAETTAADPRQERPVSEQELAAARDEIKRLTAANEANHRALVDHYMRTIRNRWHNAGFLETDRQRKAVDTLFDNIINKTPRDVALVTLREMMETSSRRRPAGSAVKKQRTDAEETARQRTAQMARFQPQSQTDQNGSAPSRPAPVARRPVTSTAQLPEEMPKFPPAVMAAMARETRGHKPRAEVPVNASMRSQWAQRHGEPVADVLKEVLRYDGLTSSRAFRVGQLNEVTLWDMDARA